MSLAPVEDESARRQRQATHPVRRPPVTHSGAPLCGCSCRARRLATSGPRAALATCTWWVPAHRGPVLGCSALLDRKEKHGFIPARPRSNRTPRAASRGWAELMVPMPTRREDWWPLAHVWALGPCRFLYSHIKESALGLIGLHRGIHDLRAASLSPVLSIPSSLSSTIQHQAETPDLTWLNGTTTLFPVIWHK
jgi:hypothetical protein